MSSTSPADKGGGARRLDPHDFAPEDLFDHLAPQEPDDDESHHAE